MGIYDFSTQKNLSKSTSIKSNIDESDTSVVLPQQLSNNSSLTKILKEIGINISAKETIYDGNNELIGVITRRDEPYFFSEDELRKLKGLIK